MRIVWALAVLLASACGKKQIGEPCSEASECEFDACLDAGHANNRRNICTKFCEAEADCPSDGTCIGGRCEATCASQKDCPEETLCIAGECLVECRSDDDCVNATCPAPGQVCEQ